MKFSIVVKTVNDEKRWKGYVSVLLFFTPA